MARRKGRLLDEVHDWGRSLRENPDAAIRNRFNQREAMLECQASLTIALGYRDLKPAVVGTCALPGTELEGRYERLLHDLRTNWTDGLGKQALQAVAALRQRIDTLEAELSRDIPQFASAILPARVEDIRARLQPDEMLIEFVAYSNRYGAFLLARTGDLRWVDLGSASAIDRPVQDLIAAANDWSVSLAGKEAGSAKTSEQTAQDALRTLSQKLSPVIAELTRRKAVARLRIAPDGMLNLVPFGGAGRYARRLPDPTFRHQLCLGGPRSDGCFRQRGGDIGGRRGKSWSDRKSAGVSSGGAFRAERLERLEDAEVEARDVKKWIPRAQLLNEGEATEQRIKQLHHPALLHIVGHGIVRGNEDCKAEPVEPGMPARKLDPAARVMSLSAIVLEEAYGRGGASSQDGLLTALELQIARSAGHANAGALAVPNGGWHAVVGRRGIRNAPRSRHRWGPDVRRPIVEDRRRHGAGADGWLLQRAQRRKGPRGSAAGGATGITRQSADGQLPSVGSGDSLGRPRPAAARAVREVSAGSARNLMDEKLHRTGRGWDGNV